LLDQVWGCNHGGYEHTAFSISIGCVPRSRKIRTSRNTYRRYKVSVTGSRGTRRSGTPICGKRHEQTSPARMVIIRIPASRAGRRHCQPSRRSGSCSHGGVFIARCFIHLI
jgi:hypothetical protein